MEMAKYNITPPKVKDASYRSLLNPSLMDNLESRIKEVIIKQKKYREKDYSAKKLAEELKTNTRYISAVVNVRFGMNYTSLVNFYRIKDAMRLLSHADNAGRTMEEISEMVGFSNRQSFYAAFYKIKKCTPREYRVEALAQHKRKGASRAEGGKADDDAGAC